jgi:hypothetical protein
VTAATHVLSFPGRMLNRGMWLYVWRVETPQGEMLYVGRTGDSSSPHATAPYTRMGQHLGFSKAANSLRRLLTENRITPEECALYELISHGPVYAEIGLREGQLREEQMRLHMPDRDKMAGLEKKLRDSLCDSGYRVLNVIHSKKEYDEEVWNEVLEAFSAHFPKLKRLSAPSAKENGQRKSNQDRSGRGHHAAEKD